ncbi:hypothetical protein ACLOJK_028112 [Asimina triloba]
MVLYIMLLGPSVGDTWWNISFLRNSGFSGITALHEGRDFLIELKLKASAFCNQMTGSTYVPIRRFCLPVAPNRQLPNEGVGAEGQPPQLQTHQGLSPDIVRALPAVQFKKMKDVETGWIDCDCAVCLGEFEDGEWLRLLPVCAHVFHSSCVDAWFQTHSNCPLCRSSVVHGLNSDIDCS